MPTAPRFMAARILAKVAARLRLSTPRQVALSDEVRFWRSLLERTNPNQRFIDLFSQRAWVERRFQPHFEKLLRHAPDGSVVRVLDVGSGPITHVGTKCERWQLEITAVDPLADEYMGLRAEFGLQDWGVRYLRGEAETLAGAFDENLFDVVYCRNALDHTRAPLLGIRQMVHVCKDDGCCWLSHSTNEGEKQRYRGLHQWNFTPRDDGDLIIQSPGARAVSLREELEGIATVQATRTGAWHTALVRPVRVESRGHVQRRKPGTGEPRAW